MKTRTFYSFAALLVIASLLLSSCALAATPQPTPTNTPLPPTATPKPTVTFTPTVTPKPTITLTPTITPNATATQRVADFTAKVEEYQKAGYISTTDGAYIYLASYSNSMAKINYFFWDTIPLVSPDNFIITSNIRWDSASSAADSSGCGYVFRIQGNNDNYVLYLSLKGYVEMASYVSNRWKSMGRGTFGKPAQNGQAKLTLIVEDNQFRVLVNDTLIKTFTGLQGKLTTGKLAYTVLSGTNKSFGTSCKFDNTELWTIKK
ncbi:MAG: hypothetical protein WA821_02390 [Anaerolineales bacterium]